MSSLNWNVSLALDSYNSLCNVVNDMTEDELNKALEIEASTQRRAALMDRMIARLVRLNEKKFAAELRKKYART